MGPTPDPGNVRAGLQGLRRPRARPGTRSTRRWPARRVPPSSGPRERRRSWSATTCARARRAWPARSPTGRPPRALTWMTGLRRPTSPTSRRPPGRPGAMFTASHNPAQYNGIGAAATPSRSAWRPARRDPGPGRRHAQRAWHRGDISTHDVLRPTPRTCSSLGPVEGRRMKVVVDAGNGMAGHTAPGRLRPAGRPVDMVPLYFELDGTFPGTTRRTRSSRPTWWTCRSGSSPRGRHRSGVRRRRRPLLPGRRARRLVSSTLTALIAARELAEGARCDGDPQPDHQLRVPEIVTELGGTPGADARRPPFIKARWPRPVRDLRRRAQRHFLLPRLLARRPGMLRAARDGGALAEAAPAVRPARCRVRALPLSGEINSEVADQAAVIDVPSPEYAGRDGVSTDRRRRSP